MSCGPIIFRCGWWSLLWKEAWWWVFGEACSTKPWPEALIFAIILWTQVIIRWQGLAILVPDLDLSVLFLISVHTFDASECTVKLGRRLINVLRLLTSSYSSYDDDYETIDLCLSILVWITVTMDSSQFIILEDGMGLGDQSS